MADEVIVGSRDPSRCTALRAVVRGRYTAGVALLRSTLLLGVGPQHARRGTADPANYEGTQLFRAPVVPGEFGDFLPQPPRRDALEAVDQPGQRDLQGKTTSRRTCCRRR